MNVLVINPGATSTKLAGFQEDTELFSTVIEHNAKELNQYSHIIDQAHYRQNLVLKALSEAGLSPRYFHAVCGRGGLYHPIPSGTYRVSDAVMRDIEMATYGEHASNLGAYLARRIGDMAGIPSFFVDPVCVDELSEVAHYTGFSSMRRLCQFHALNQKSVARKAAALLGLSYESARLIVCHLGGGVSVAAHEYGRVVDVFNVKDEGSMGLDRAGSLPVNALIDYCFSGLSKEQVKRILGRESGVFSYLGTTDFREITARVRAGDPKYTKVYEALVYQLSKDIGAMAAVLSFDIDAIVYTGGMAFDQKFCNDISARVNKLGTILRIPGEEEMRSLAEGALRVLHGEKAKDYEEEAL